MNIAIYARKSCITDTGESIQNQIDICKKHIFENLNKYKSSNIIIYQDEGFSAKSTDRPEFKRMIEDAENKKISSIVCYKLDRISRNIIDFSKLIEKLSKMSISFICVKEQFDTSVPMGRAMMYMASIFAQLERETIAERVKDNMIMLSKHGQWLGGTTPLGMKSDRIVEKRPNFNQKFKFHLKENSEEIKIVYKIYSKFLECKSLAKTKTYLDSINMKTKKGNNFSIPTIKKILSNPIYCAADNDARKYLEELGATICFSPCECNPAVGIIAYNKRNYCENHGKLNPFSDWIIALGTHKGIIAGQHWITINKILNSRKFTYKTDNSIFAGKIICKKCNSKMLQKRRKNHTNFDYICATKIYNSSKNCACCNLNGKGTDTLIMLKIISEGIKNNSYFVRKLSALMGNQLINTKFSELKHQKNGFNISMILENTSKYKQMNFANKTINCIFWDNTSIEIQLKNCNY